MCLFFEHYSNNLCRLFFGDNDHAINVSSIRIIEHNLNLESAIGAITALDNIISNKIYGRIHTISSASGYGSKLSVLFDSALRGTKGKKLNQYVFDTFLCFAKNKTKIDINIDKLASYVQDKALVNLVFHEVDKNDDETKEENLKNLIRPQMFQIFDNVQEIAIDTGGYYKFSASRFLSLIENTKINKASGISWQGVDVRAKGFEVHKIYNYLIRSGMCDDTKRNDEPSNSQTDNSDLQPSAISDDDEESETKTDDYEKDHDDGDDIFRWDMTYDSDSL